MAEARRKVDAEAPFQSQCKDMEIILKFNTKGVKNFLDLTIIKSCKRKTALIVIDLAINNES